MKSVRNFLKTSVIVMVLFLSSCSDYLDTTPITEDTITDTNGIVIVDAADAESRMNAVYGTFASGYWQLDFLLAGDGQSDNAYIGADNPAIFQYETYQMLSTNSQMKGDWNDIYNNINTCNIIINYVDQASDLTTTRRDEMIGEASLIRALNHFHAVQLWGDCPIATQAVFSVSSENFDEVFDALFPTRKPVAEVYDQIIEDCLIAIDMAPDGSNKFKANKMGAKALLAKVYATMPNPDWIKTIQYCDEVLAGGYILLPTYDHLFDSAHEGNDESIWEVNGEGWGSPIGAWNTFMFLGTDWKKFNAPSHTLVQAFTANGDTQRKASTITTANVGWADTYWSSTNYPFAYKMRDTNGNQNFYLARLADILLLKAEALASLGDVPGAMALVNQVRTRAGISTISAVDQSDAVYKILEERLMELAFEGDRWFDLKRMGKAVEILSQQKDGNGVVLPSASNINQNRLLWPIPQDKLDANGLLTQNPGY
ncbi:RagB/SusD family nutrient uptake outer membrane protein [Flavobacterium sp. NRK F10]|uniref:RagB/SusD family nutrient uptake outer membrane protein n=1 Tax=Flavobacterium sp. NRK F10 TaxID=2954931 RepID=UPI00209128F4|nr:RagB/SusD family nutrient uptake outer membrane protein [Flavobacterium sp. NRK F10]MCO6176009.1 RagB/SusD family nutrient uptake outer membrane protein [Flavobacterium sp. NRK F10]